MVLQVGHRAVFQSVSNYAYQATMYTPSRPVLLNNCKYNLIILTRLRGNKIKSILTEEVKQNNVE